MKKPWFLPLSLFLLVTSLIIFIILLLTGKDFAQLFSNPFDTSWSLAYPSQAALGPQGDLVVIDRGQGRITKLDKQGVIQWQRNGTKREHGFFIATELVMDNHNDIYVINQILSKNGFRTTRQELVRLDSQGNFKEVIHGVDYDNRILDNHLVTRGTWLGLGLRRSSDQSQELFWYQLEPEGIVECIYSIETKTLKSKTIKFMADSPAWIASVTPMAQGWVYVSKAGLVNHLRSDGTELTIYDSSHFPNQGGSIPWWVRGDTKGGVFLSDLGRGSILHWDGREWLSVSPLDGKSIYYQFTLNENGTIVTTNDKGVLICTSADVYSLVTKGNPHWGLSGLRLIAWVGLLSLILSIILAIISIFDTTLFRKTSILTQQLLMLIPVLMVFVFLSASLLFYGFSQSFGKQSMENLSSMVQIIGSGVDLEKLSKIQDQGDFMNPDYQAIRTYLHGALNYNRDPWNKSLYFALYTVHNNSIKTLMYLNDGVAPFHPFTFLTDPSLSFVKAAAGYTNTTSAIDQWGSWTFATGPVFDREGRVAAVLEIGRDFYGYEREYQSYFMQRIPLILVFLLLIVVGFGIFSWFILGPLWKLLRSLRSVSMGYWALSLSEYGPEEITILARTINAMSKHIQGYSEDLLTLAERNQVALDLSRFEYKNRESAISLERDKFAIRRRGGIIIRHFETWFECFLPPTSICSHGELSTILELNNPRTARISVFIASNGEAGDLRSTVPLLSLLSQAANLLGIQSVATDLYLDHHVQENLNFRFIGSIQYGGATDQVPIFELIKDSDHGSSLAPPLVLEPAIIAFQGQRLTQARELLSKAREDYPQDPVVKAYLGWVEDTITHKPGTVWTGTIPLPRYR